MDKFDLDYESLKKINPGIVYANATGFGPLGKYAGKPGVDIMGQAMGGIMGKTGFEGHPPTPAAASIADQTGAILLCSGILAALVKKEKTYAQKTPFLYGVLINKIFKVIFLCIMTFIPKI